MKHQNFLVRLRQSARGGLEMNCQNLILAARIFGEKAVNRLGIGPILTGVWNTFADVNGRSKPARDGQLNRPL
jgi:hypothetical protein